MGAFYLDGQQTQVSTVFGTPFLNDFLTSEQWALFGEAHYALSERLNATVGVRYFEDERNVDNRDPGVAAALTGFGIAAERELNFDALTPRLNLSYTTASEVLIYGNVAQGFRSGLHQNAALLLGVLGAGGTAPLYVDEETVWSYEIGLKAPLFNRALAFETAIYYNDWRDLQVQTTALVTTPGGPVPVAYVQNAGEAHSVGLDLNLVYTGIEGLRLQFGANINDSVYDSALPGLAGIEEGDRIANVPELTLTASADYEWALGGDWEGVVRTNVAHNAERLDYFGGVASESDPLTFWGGRVGIQNERFGFFITGENLSDERGKLENLTVLGALHAHPQPRTIGVALQVNY